MNKSAKPLIRKDCVDFQMRILPKYNGCTKKGSRFLILKADVSRLSDGLLIIWVLPEHPLLLPDVSLLFV